MKRFANSREATEFVASRIVTEALRAGAPLSDAERHELYFSESADEPATEEIAEGVDPAYEAKIARFIRMSDREARRQGGEEYETWRSAINLVKKRDCYLGVMIDQAGLRPPGDFLKLVATATAICGIVVVVAFVFAKYDLPPENISAYLWAACISLALSLCLLRLIMGKERFDKLINWFYEKLTPIKQR